MPAPVTVVDAVGKPCPLPVIELARAVAAAEVGDLVEVLADDPGADVDIPVWCRMRRQELVGVADRPGARAYTVRRLS